MRRVRTIQYKALTAPVLTTAQFKETVTEDRWHRPFSEPVRLKTLPLAVIVASGLFQPVLTTGQFKEAVTEDRWHQPLTEPVRLKTLPVAVTASGSFQVPFVEPVTESRWHQALTEPVRLKTLPVAVLVSAGQTWAPFVPAVTLDRYHQPLAIPTRRVGIPTAVTSPAGVTPSVETVTLDKWFQSFVHPVRRIVSPDTSGAIWSTVTPVAETVTLDKWYKPLANPTLRGGLPVTEQPYLAFVKAAPFAEAVSIDKWLQPLSQPWVSRRLPRAVEFPALFYSNTIVGNAAATVWNAADKSANIALGRNDTGAWSSASNGSWKSVRATTSKSTGKWYLEIIGGYLQNNGHIVGFANSTAALSNFLGNDGNSFGYQSEGSVWGLAGSWQGSGFIGEVIKLAIDLDAKLVWARTDAAPNWNNSALADPATGVGGKSYTTAGALYPACSLFGDLANLHNNAAILNPGSSTFAGALPSGFTAWDTRVPNSTGISGTAPTVWDSVNKNAAVVLSGNNLVATQSGASNDWRGVRSTTSYDSGLRYFEATITATSVGGWEIGLQDGDEVFSASTGPGSSWRSIAFRDGTNDIYFMNLSNLGTVVWSGGIASQVIGIAADMSRGLVWAKNITTGSNWNADANADPVLGKRGSYIGSIKPMYIAWGGNRAGGVDDVVTLNTGATPFIGTLPTGYSAWDDTGSGNLHMRGFMVNINRMMNT